MEIICGAKTRAGTPCRHEAGWGTDHLGTGRCKLHGGLSPGAPKGNQYAVKTHKYSFIGFDQLTEKEQELWDQIPTDPVAQCEYGIRVCAVRERRMLERITELREMADADGMVQIEAVSESGFNSFGDIQTQRSRRVLALDQINAVESALSKVQKDKRGFVELLHKVKQGTADDDALIKLATAIEQMGGAGKK